MAENTQISWARHTWNPWMGCTKVSPACDGCYAEALMDKRYGKVQWGNHPRVRTGAQTWNDPHRWQRQAEKDGDRPFVFCASLADIFDNQVDPQWRIDAFSVMRRTPNLIYLLLTKRPQNIVKLCREAGGLPDNAALGATVEDQKRAEHNVLPLLLAKQQLNPLFAFVSCEPLLGGIDLNDIACGNDEYVDALNIRLWEHEIENWRDTEPEWEESFLDWYNLSDMPSGPMLPRLDWVITGGETDQGGHKARPTHPAWLRSVRDQCKAAGVPFHHKQNGEWISVSEVAGSGDHFKFEDGSTVRRIGKRHSGRTIDGVTHDAFPAVSS